MRKKSKFGCLAATIPVSAGIIIILVAIEISKHGYDYPALLYFGLAVSFIGVFLTSLWFWDFLREKLGFR